MNQQNCASAGRASRGPSIYIANASEYKYGAIEDKKLGNPDNAIISTIGEHYLALMVLSLMLCIDLKVTPVHGRRANR